MEDLSSASANRNTRRMSDDVHKTSRIAHPPRAPLPVSSRVSLSDGNTQDMDYLFAHEKDEQVAVSARPTSVSEEGKPETVEPIDHVKHVLTSLQRVQTSFHYSTTPQQREFVRACTAPPGLTRVVYTQPLTSVLIASVVSLVLGTMLSSEQKASTACKRVSTSCRRAVDDILRFA